MSSKPEDLEKVVLRVNEQGTPVLLRDVARVQLGPDMRRGAAELDGLGEAVGGIVIVRFGENSLKVIESVKAKIKQISKALPQGVEIVPVYDRSTLIEESIKTLKEKLIEESIIVSLVCILFLFHFRSALVAILTLPLALLMSFTAMHAMGQSSNIMSLGGIAIAIGAMVDATIVMVENAHKRLEHAPPGSDRRQVIIQAAQEVGKPLFYSLLIITVSFLPVFTLEAQEGRLFRPLAFTKTFSMLFASLLSITVAPALMLLLIRGRITRRGEEPDQPLPDRHLPAGLPFRLPLAQGDPWGQCPGARGHRPRLQDARQRVHAPAVRRHAPLHADEPSRASQLPKRRRFCRSRTRS